MHAVIVKRLPEHLRTKRGRERLDRLRNCANALRGYFGVPVYLVGSALLDANEEPRDWDLRLSLPEADFKRRFGSPDAWNEEGRTGKYTRVRWSWSDEMVKQSKNSSARTALNCDVQAYPEKHFRAYRNLPRLRLDTR